MVFKECTYINKYTGEIRHGNIDTELEYLEEYPYRELSKDSVELQAEYLKQEKAKSHSINTLKHKEFQNKPFDIVIKRDDIKKPDLTLIFNCTDDSRFNIKSAYDVAIEDNQVYFYDGRGVGDYLSTTEMKQAVDQFKDRLNPTFEIKGKTKLAINMAKTTQDLDLILTDLKY